MKSLFIVLTFLTGCLVQADDLATARMRMATVLSELASHNKVSFVITGAVTDGSDNTPFQTSIVFVKEVVDGKLIITAEIIETVNSNIVSRIVADGTRLWVYDVATNSYRSSNYATESMIGQELDRLFRLLALRTTDHTSFLVRILSDTYGSKSNQNVSNWMPWRPNSVIGFADKSIVCGSNEPFSNNLVYIISEGPNMGLILFGADYQEESVISGRTRIVHWQLAVQSYDIPVGSSFEFIPPPRSRALASSEPGGG